MKHSSHFLQAHALLNLRIIHSSQQPYLEKDVDGDARKTRSPDPDSIHPGLGAAGIQGAFAREYGPTNRDDGITFTADFNAMQLLKVMSRITQQSYIPYFILCRELGIRAVDSMIRSKILDLRWTEPITSENPDTAPNSPVDVDHQNGRSSDTAVDASDDGMDPVDDRDLLQDREASYQELMSIVGPKLVPTTPIMRYAMREVIQEYEEEQSPSEYASLSDVDEY